MKIFFIGDTHFYHRNIIKYCDRPFVSVEEMNEEVIKRWNERVSKDDIVYMMGDFALCSKQKKKEILQKLNGHIYLIKGNHDEGSIKSYYDIGFERVYEHPIIINNFWILSHEPMFINEAMPYVNIFAHVHNNPQYCSSGSNFVCVSGERTNFYPVSFDDIEELLEYNHSNGLYGTSFEQFFNLKSS